MGYLLSFIFGIVSLIPAIIIKMVCKKSFSMEKSAMLTFVCAIISCYLIALISYPFKIEVQSLSVITMLIMAIGSYNILHK